MRQLIHLAWLLFLNFFVYSFAYLGELLKDDGQLVLVYYRYWARRYDKKYANIDEVEETTLPVPNPKWAN